MTWSDHSGHDGLKSECGPCLRADSTRLSPLVADDAQPWNITLDAIETYVEMLVAELASATYEEIENKVRLERHYIREDWYPVHAALTLEACRRSLRGECLPINDYCEHPGLFANYAPTEHCFVCGRDVPIAEL
jgi:hypothetical protein